MLTIKSVYLLLLQEIKAHPFFEGIDWQNLHTQAPPYVPRVDHELDTQNFERFDEDMAMASPGKLDMGCDGCVEPAAAAAAGTP